MRLNVHYPSDRYIGSFCRLYGKCKHRTYVSLDRGHCQSKFMHVRPATQQYLYRLDWTNYFHVRFPLAFRLGRSSRGCDRDVGGGSYIAEELRRLFAVQVNTRTNIVEGLAGIVAPEVARYLQTAQSRQASYRANPQNMSTGQS